jgi:Lrp/AsnC family transcriptional regulator, regulator for asnA, asnC and gidA
VNAKPVLDAIDEKIIGVLQGNGRLSNRAVGRKLGLSEAAIRKRLKRMIESGAISYTLIVDINAAGMSFFGWLRVKTTAKKALAVAEILSNLRMSALSAVTSGEASVVGYVFARDLASLAALLEKISNVDGVINVHFRQAVKHTRHRYEYVQISASEPIEHWGEDTEL